MKALFRLLFLAGSALAVWMTVLGLTGFRARPRPAQIGVIFGTAVTADGHPRPALQERLEEGRNLWNSGTVTTLMVSGAIERRTHQDEAQDEARIMARWLEARGVPASAIIIDSHGNNTWLTALHVAALRPRGAVVVSQWFHIDRARWALRHAGVRSVSAAPTRTVRLPQIWYLFREAMAFPVYVLTKKASLPSAQ
ncbi:YdcF family protein [Gluconobacter morbifer]|uniref:DUF218 domain-containing protein n=1 Tax=Gluconobacter morbifer G707 TaxID=1088869 RepID=G6XJ83_9PROT|nr:YdcF family protein [Gluconobacter morbifer]EHH68199.1 hypothetical protein GMO_15490 [Gluconobacter morbifer G707]